MGDLGVVPLGDKERADFYQQRMKALEMQMHGPATGSEAYMHTLYLQFCRWDSARVERNKALKLLGQPVQPVKPEPVPPMVQALANIFFP